MPVKGGVGGGGEGAKHLARMDLNMGKILPTDREGLFLPFSFSSRKLPTSRR